MLGKNLILYSRGFAGSAAEATMASHRKKSKTILSVFDLSHEEIEQSVVNEQVVRAFNQLARRQVDTTDFDWRENCIRVIIRAFGTLDAKEWITACERSPLFTETHAEFIEDWINYCITGRRKLPIWTWERMIAPGANEPSRPNRVKAEVVASIPRGHSRILNVDTGSKNMHELISLSLARPGGFTDLLMTANILFGEDTN